MLLAAAGSKHVDHRDREELLARLRGAPTGYNRGTGARSRSVGSAAPPTLAAKAHAVAGKLYLDPPQNTIELLCRSTRTPSQIEALNLSQPSLPLRDRPARAEGHPRPQAERAHHRRCFATPVQATNPRSALRPLR